MKGNIESSGLVGRIKNLIIDKTLSISGACADAAATGAEVARLQQGIDAFEEYQTQKIQDVVDVHANNKDNPHGVSTEQIGAVNKSGDTMTGDLTIRSTANYPGVLIDKGSTTKAGFQFAGQGVFITAEAVKNGTHSKRQLYLRNIGNQGNIKNSLAIVNIVTPEGGEATTTTTLIYGEHNPQPTTFVGSYVGTGTSGPDNPVTIQFPNTPKRWGMLGNLATDGGATNKFVPYACQESSFAGGMANLPFGVDVLISATYGGKAYVTYSGNSVSFHSQYGVENAGEIMNGAGVTYYYYAEY